MWVQKGPKGAWRSSAFRAGAVCTYGAGAGAPTPLFRWRERVKQSQ